MGAPATTREVGVTQQMHPLNTSSIRQTADGEVPFKLQALISEPVNRAFRTGV